MRFCSLASGSNGNSYFVEQGNSRVLIDLGISAKQAETALREIGVEPSSIRAVLITHEHSDHTRGTGVWTRRYRIPVMATEATLQAMVRSSALGDIPGELLYPIQPRRRYNMEGLAIETFAPFHDAADPLGYSLTDGTRRITVMTDTGMVSPEMENYLIASDLAVVESNYDVRMLLTGRYPAQLKKRIRSNMGHLSNEDCGQLLARVLSRNPRLKVLLGHLSEENNYPELALETVRNLVDPILPLEKQDIGLAPRGERTPLFRIE